MGNHLREEHLEDGMTPGMTEALAALCAGLRAEPLFHMSLGSKELFHSNFIAWFADNFPDLATPAFATWTTPQPGAVGGRTERESAHLDLVVRLPGLSPIAIENKVFSVPDEEQLDRYSALLDQTELNGVRHSRVLLSLVSPGWADRAYRGWQLRSFGDLGKALASQLQDIRMVDAFSADLVDHYLTLIRLLDGVFEILGAPAADAPLLLPAPILQELEATRLSAGIQKARASHIARDLRNAIRARWSDIDVDHGFTNGLSLLQVFRRVPTEPDSPPDWVGWQLQGTQFRLAVMCGSASLQGPARRVEREAYVTETYGEWFQFGVLEEVSGSPLGRGGRHSFQCYNPNFVYQYRPAPNLSPDQLRLLGVRYMELAEGRG